MFIEENERLTMWYKMEELQRSLNTLSASVHKCGLLFQNPVDLNSEMVKEYINCLNDVNSKSEFTVNKLYTGLAEFKAYADLVLAKVSFAEGKHDIGE